MAITRKITYNTTRLPGGGPIWIATPEWYKQQALIQFLNKLHCKPSFDV